MKSAIFLVLVTVLWHVVGARTWAQEAPKPGDAALANLIAKQKEAQRAKDIEFLHVLVAGVKERGYVSIPENSSLETRVGRLIEDKVLGLTAAQRQRLMKDTLGESDYSTLVQVLLAQLGSSDINQQGSALKSLGYPLFALEARDQIKPWLFRPDPRAQLLALESLVYLDVPGTNRLLMSTLLRGIPLDYEAALAVRALWISNDSELDRIALEVRKANPGGTVFSTLLPILRKRSDYRQLVAELFKSDAFYVPDQEQIPWEKLGNRHAEHVLLDEIFRNPTPFMADEAIKKKVLMYASADHNDLFTLPLIILEKSGQELGYFTEMQKDPQLSPEKNHVLEKIVSRIQRGERLR